MFSWHFIQNIFDFKDIMKILSIGDQTRVVLFWAKFHCISIDFEKNAVICKFFNDDPV